jgi:ankyrin repeat protein
MKATVHHFEEIIELLLNAGANVNAKNEEGKTALKIGDRPLDLRGIKGWSDNKIG